MKVLFTGSSSFTGYWFVKELHAAGHEVVTVLRKPPEVYTGTRGVRVQQLSGISRMVHGCSFGDDIFMQLVQGESWDLLCHHAADVTNYKSPDFDPVAAAANNTHNISAVLEALHGQGCHHVVLTGTVFEQREGAGSADLTAFSPYGLSKGLTHDLFRYYTRTHQFRLGKFVIPNPFGPYEEERFTSFLVKSWKQGKRPCCDYPNYVRDNIHVSLLAKAYCRFVEQFVAGGPSKCAPSGYPESQGAFTERFAKELSSRLGIPCPVDMVEHHPFPEPKVRINTDVFDYAELGWDEKAAWDELAEYYKGQYG